MTRTGILCLAAICLACTDAELTTTRERLGDTILVSSRAPAVADTAVMVLVARFGQFDGTPENEFGEIRSFAIDEEGGLYAYDSGQGIKSFDPQGRFVGWLARVGQGPAEVGCTPLIATHEGTVAVRDGCNQRITLFRPGSSPASVRVPEGRRRDGEDGLYFDSSGALWVGLMPLLPRTGGLGFPRPIAARMDEDGILRDTIFVPARYAERCPILSEWQYQAGYWEDKREQWYPKVKWAMGTDGRVAFGCPRKFELDVLTRGAPLLRIAKPWRPVETTPDERAFYEQWWAPIPALPQLRPAYARIILPADGRTWVWPEQPSQHLPYNEESQQMTGRRYGWMAGTQGAFEVFAADGRWQGTVRIPESVEYSGYPTTPPVVIRGDTVWAVMRDSLDVQYVGRFRGTVG